MSFIVKFWGTRGSIPTPGSGTAKYGGNTSCVEIRCGQTLLICDAGTGIRELGLDLTRRGAGAITAHMFFSHAHWDHIQGFPFFTPAYDAANTFHVYGHHDNRTIHSILSGQMSSEHFPVRFDDLGANIVPGHLPESLQIADVTVTHFRQWHPGSSLGFRFDYQGRSVVFSTDNEIDAALENAAEVDADSTIERKLPADFLKFCEGADLLICDGQYLDDEYPEKRGWGHPRVSTVVDLAVQAGVKQLAVTHHDPMHTDRDIDAKIEFCRQRAATAARPPLVFGARDALELKLSDHPL